MWKQKSTPVIGRGEYKGWSTWPDQSVPGFDRKITEIFSDHYASLDDIEKKISKKTDKYRKKFRIRAYQKFVRDYLGRTNYRGLLAVHGLGSGKTFTAILTMSMLNMETVIITPAALRANWKQKIARRVRKKSLTHKIHFVSYNASNFVEQYKKLDPKIIFDPKLNNFDGKFIIIDESHEFFQNVISGKARQAVQIYRYLLGCRNSKILFLTGTPIVGDPFELAVCCNVLRGYLYDGQRKRYTLFPKMRKDFYNHFVTIADDKLHIKNKSVLKERITGLVSYYRGPKDPNRHIFPFVHKTKIILCPMGRGQWIYYQRIRQKEQDMERKFKYLTQEFMIEEFKKPTRASIGTYKTNSAKVCNFAFPVSVEKKFNAIMENYLKNISYNQTVDPSIWNVINKNFGFTGPWPSKIKIAEIKWRLMQNLIPMSEILLNIADLSGKFNKLLEIIKINQNKKFIFSKFRVLGVKILGELLKESGFSQIRKLEDYRQNQSLKKRAFMIVDGSVSNKSELINLYNRKDNFDGKICEIILGTQVLSKGISLFNVREVYITEAQWRDTTIKQIQGRAARLFSHKDLPKENRSIKTFILISIPEDRTTISSHSAQMTTDEFLLDLAAKKNRFNDEFFHAMKESAVDCRLNISFNRVDTEEEILCKSCPLGVKRSLFPPNYVDHIIQGPTCDNLYDNVNLWDVKGYPELKKDSEGHVYKLVDDTWMEVGKILSDDRLMFWNKN